MKISQDGGIRYELSLITQDFVKELIFNMKTQTTQIVNYIKLKPIQDTHYIYICLIIPVRQFHPIIIP